MNSQLANFFECRSKRTVAVIAIAVSILLGVLDLTTGIEMQFLLVYLIPIFLASWFVSQAVGNLLGDSRITGLVCRRLSERPGIFFAMDRLRQPAHVHQSIRGLRIDPSISQN